MPLADDVTSARLRRIAQGRPDGGLVLSVLVDLDPASLPTPEARESAIASAVDQAHREVERQDVGHAERLRLRAAADGLEAVLTPKGGPVKGARALAAFAPLHEDSAEIDVLRLPEPVRAAVRIDRQPLVEPLVPLTVGERWCVALVDRSEARFYLGDRHALAQTGQLRDRVHGRHDQGGWSQANYQRHIEEEVHRHVVRVADALRHALVPAGLYDHLLIGASQPLRAAVSERLHPSVQERIVDWLDLDLSRARDSDVREAAGAAIERFEEDHRKQALDRLQAAVGRPDAPGAHGWQDVLFALSERRVGELLVDDGEHPAGKRCPRCGLLATAADGNGRCPADGTPMEPVADVAQAAIAAAYAQDADVDVLHDEPRLQTLGGVGAVLRF
jgi:peptide chain release factor subunit 1